ncbi:GspH/FimT family pseudopilin [Methylobacillus glycogenes]|uniref:GspH/FimT family pseudopilin n=1 Tax=Methylobacillus glycogenes TaxID=406 RepID=UPI0004709AD5|nr:GspH/FimT family pseudopilin [Methylobacillus glycogenes]
MSSRQQGFTLVEMMVTLAISIILLSVAIPSFSDMLGNMKIRAAAQNINTGLQLARAEAIRRNTNVVFTLGEYPAWSVGCQIVVVDVDADGVEDCPEVIQNKSSNEGAANIAVEVTPAGTGRITFNGMGRVTYNNDGSNPVRQLDFTSTGGGSRNLRILIRGGSVHFCDPAVTTVGDPRACA